MSRQSTTKLRIVNGPGSQTAGEISRDALGNVEQPEVIAFDQFLLDPRDHRLIGREGPIRLGKKALRVLELLIAANGRLVTKAELLETVWARTVVSESALTSVIKELRRALGDTSRSPQYIESIYGSGYRFLASVKHQAIQSAPIGTKNLPQPLSALIGREQDLAAIAESLANGRLVTIAGPGGVGKSRLAIEAARAAPSDWPDGVWLVELASINGQDGIADAIASTMGMHLPPEGNADAAIVRQLRSCSCLIVLDNCEHLIDSAARIVGSIVSTTPGITFLCTSQEPLGIEGEQIHRLEPLAPQPALQLFAERVRSIDGIYDAESDSATIAAICRHLDCMPLAIEMAATRVPAFGCAEVLRMLNDRFGFLANERRMAARRQRTLLDALDWTYALLSPVEARVFRQLGIFPGSFSPKIASLLLCDEEFSSGEVLSVIASLVNRSLLVPQGGRGAHRLRMLETLRIFAVAKLEETGEDHAARRRFADFLAKYVKSVWDEYCGQPITDEELDSRFLQELENVRQAIDWSYGAQGEPEIGHLLVTRSLHLWQGRERVLLAILRKASAHVSAETPRDVYAMLCVAQAVLELRLRPENASLCAQIAIDEIRRVPGAVWPLCYSLCTLGFAAWIAKDLKRAREISDEVQAIVPRARPSRGLGFANAFEAIVLSREGKYEAAQKLVSENNADLTRMGARGLTRFWQATALRFVTEEDQVDEIERWRQLLSLIHPDDLLATEVLALALVELGTRLARRGASADLEEAAELIAQHAEIIAQAEEPGLMLMLAEVALRRGQVTIAAVACGRARAIRQEGDDYIGDEPSVSLRQALEQVLDPVPLDDAMALGAQTTPRGVLELFFESIDRASGDGGLT